MLKWLLRIVVGMIALVGLFAGAAAIAFSLWRSGHVRALEGDSEIVATALGDIEVAVVGEGLPILSLHGTPGGYDQALSGRRADPESHDRSSTIAVSRPGYLRTPLSSGATFEAQADLFAALLDELEIDRAVVYAASGGGYAGLQFVLRHPDRTLGLILYAPSVNYEPLAEGVIESMDSGGLAQELTAWAMSGPMLRMFGPSYLRNFDPSDPYQLAMGRVLITSLVPVAARAEGRANDVLQRDDPEIDEWPLERITVPTLILHGNADDSSAYEGSVSVAAKIPNAELVTFEGGDHLIVITRADEIRAHVDRFIDGLE